MAITAIRREVVFHWSLAAFAAGGAWDSASQYYYLRKAGRQEKNGNLLNFPAFLLSLDKK